MPRDGHTLSPAMKGMSMTYGSERRLVLIPHRVCSSPPLLMYASLFSAQASIRSTEVCAVLERQWKSER